MGKVYFPMDKTPEEWREMARNCFRQEQESFERSDTDGFLSQWASSVMGQLYRTLADVAENGGVADFRMLADAEGNIIEGAREVKTRYGWRWVTPDGVWFSPSHDSNEERRKAKNLAKGFQFVMVEREAVVTMLEGGAWGCYPAVIPKRQQ